jgi:NhaP-type Na+/H+ or K+/H+ antiporter
VLYLTLFVLLGVATLRKGHYVLFCVGIIFPVLWIVGALLGPTDRVAATEARSSLQ